MITQTISFMFKITTRRAHPHMPTKTCMYDGKIPKGILEHKHTYKRAHNTRTHNHTDNRTHNLAQYHTQYQITLLTCNATSLFHITEGYNHQELQI